MKKILFIEDKKGEMDYYYLDTDKAELIYEDFSDVNNPRSLYQTKKKNYFRTYKNGTIEPLTDDQAKEFLGNKDPDLFIKVFGKTKEW